jgi:hypothetical protein
MNKMFAERARGLSERVQVRSPSVWNTVDSQIGSQIVDGNEENVWSIHWRRDFVAPEWVMPDREGRKGG